MFITKLMNTKSDPESLLSHKTKDYVCQNPASLPQAPQRALEFQSQLGNKGCLGKGMTLRVSSGFTGCLHFWICKVFILLPPT